MPHPTTFPHSPRRTLTPSLGVSILVLLTAAILLGLTITLFTAARAVDLKDLQKYAVRIGCIALALLSLTGLVIAIIDLILRLDHRKADPTQDYLPYQPPLRNPLAPAPSVMETHPLLTTEGFALADPVQPNPPVTPQLETHPGLLQPPEPPLE